jgi:hypothetical protein
VTRRRLIVSAAVFAGAAAVYVFAAWTLGRGARDLEWHER